MDALSELVASFGLRACPPLAAALLDAPLGCAVPEGDATVSGGRAVAGGA